MMDNSINWGLLSSLNQIAPIKAQQVSAQPAQMPNLSSASNDNSINSINKSLPTNNDFSSVLGDALTQAVNNLNSPNPVSVTNDALQQHLQNISPQDLGNALLNQNQLTSMPSKINQSIPNNGLSIPAIQQAAMQSFPNNPNMQKIAMAQAAQESGLLGKPSQLASQYNNLFGVKGTGTAGSVNMPTNEFVNGQMQKVNSPFASYNSIQDSMNSYKNLMNNPRYQGVLNAKTPQEGFEALQKAGYATDPNYSKNLNNVYEKLNKVTEQAVNNNIKQFTASKDPLQMIQAAHRANTPNITGGIPVTPQLEKSTAFQKTMQSYSSARQAGLTKSPYVVSVDFTQPATAKRLSVINAETGKIVFQSEVAQGKTPGFSNTPESHQSSTGTFLTDQTYDGKHGYSLRVRGLDKGVNDNAYMRNIVVHGSDYIGGGKQGHSFGCFAVPSNVTPTLINLIKNGTIIYSYGGN